MNKKRIKLVVIILLAFVLAGVYTVTNLDTMMLVMSGEEKVNFRVEGEMAYMNGVITSDIVEDVQSLINRNPEVKVIVMENVPGSIDDESNLMAARLIRESGLNTNVPKNGSVESGGVDFFCAGVNRSIAKSAMVGVHSWDVPLSENQGDELEIDDEQHKLYLDYYKEMGIPDAFYWFTLRAAPPEEIHYMTIEELETYGLLAN